MINIGDMFILSKNRVKRMFFEDVEEFFKENEISYILDIYIEGKAFKQKIDFAISKTKNKPERLVKLVNNPTRNFYERYLFLFVDIREGSAPHTSAERILLINDTEKRVNSSDIESIKSYEIMSIQWSLKENNIDLLK